MNKTKKLAEVLMLLQSASDLLEDVKKEAMVELNYPIIDEVTYYKSLVNQVIHDSDLGNGYTTFLRETVFKQNPVLDETKEIEPEIPELSME